MFFIVLFNAILPVILTLLVILTKYDVKLDKLNKLLIFLLYVFSLAIPFWEQIRMCGALAFYDVNHFQPFGAVYLVLGFPIFIYGVVNFFRIVHENNKATNGKNATPQSLLTTGFYSKMRHPMYTMIILLNLAWSVTFGSIFGLFSGIFVALIFMYDAIREEEKQLIPKFGNAYTAYSKEVPSRFFPTFQCTLVLALLILGSIGTILEIL